MTLFTLSDARRARAQIVAWLRDKWDGGLVEPILDAIEAGEYRNG